MANTTSETSEEEQVLTRVLVNTKDIYPHELARRSYVKDMLTVTIALRVRSHSTRAIGRSQTDELLA
jgi:hypothetical protein